jgi:hypothetical protein
VLIIQDPGCHENDPRLYEGGNGFFTQVLDFEPKPGLWAICYFPTNVDAPLALAIRDLDLHHSDDLLAYSLDNPVFP